MTAMADLGLVTDARGLLVELARRLGLDGARRALDRTGGDLECLSGVVRRRRRRRRTGRRRRPPSRSPGPGARWCCVERGPFPGSKNVYGGVVYGRVLDEIVPGWWEEVPVERWVVRRSTMMMTGDPVALGRLPIRGLGCRRPTTG